MRLPRPRWRWLVRGVVAAVSVLGLVVGGIWWSGNLGTVVPRRVHRSAQLGPDHLEKVIRGREIKTVLNLRGENPTERWYRDERTAALRAGAVLIDFPMASDQWLSHDQFRALVGTLDGCDYPLLIHCEWGAERT